MTADHDKESQPPVEYKFPPAEYSMVAPIIIQKSLDLVVPVRCTKCPQQHLRSKWVQLAGHRGSLSPAGPGTIWKKLQNDKNELYAYKSLMQDSAAQKIVPAFYKEVEYEGETFIEISDLLHKLEDPCIIDIKMGTRTFLESEVCNTAKREDLYKKMLALNPEAATDDEKIEGKVTKLRYMEFRENMTSTRSLGFRIEAVKMSSKKVEEIKKVKTEEHVEETLLSYLQNSERIRINVLSKLLQLRESFEASEFFKEHEVIGSSLLIVYDKDRIDIKMIDFAKTLRIPEGLRLNHKTKWSYGNHEDGYLFGLDNLIRILQNVNFDKKI